MEEYRATLKKNIIENLRPGDANVKKMYTTHYYFLQNKKLLSAVSDLIKYHIATPEIPEGINITNIILKDIDDFLCLMAEYDSLGKYFSIFKDILSLENYKLLLMLNNIPIYLYSTTVAFDEDYEKDLEFISVDVGLLEASVKQLAAAVFMDGLKGGAS